MKGTNIWPLQQSCEFLQQKHWIISLFNDQGILRPCEVWTTYSESHSKKETQPKLKFRSSDACSGIPAHPASSILHPHQPLCQQVKKEDEETRTASSTSFLPHTCLLSGYRGRMTSPEKWKGMLTPLLFILCHYTSMERSILAKYSQNIPNESLLFPNKEAKQISLNSFSLSHHPLWLF